MQIPNPRERIIQPVPRVDGWGGRSRNIPQGEAKRTDFVKKRDFDPNAPALNRGSEFGVWGSGFGVRRNFRLPESRTPNPAFFHAASLQNLLFVSIFWDCTHGWVSPTNFTQFLDFRNLAEPIIILSTPQIGLDSGFCCVQSQTRPTRNLLPSGMMNSMNPLKQQRRPSGHKLDEVL